MEIKKWIRSKMLAKAIITYLVLIAVKKSIISHDVLIPEIIDSTWFTLVATVTML